jgi:signal transduction histidine kinase/DNA-binding response OmpR family regulator/putative methionine-R-sulfoxide reductase with GAF domain
MDGRGIGEGETILLVDDDPDVATAVEEFLQRAGHVVAVAHTGQEALDVLHGGSIALLLLDLGLPDMDGVEVMRKAQSGDAGPDVVVVTAHASLASAIAALESGAAGYVEKPVDLDRLGTLVRNVLGRRRLARDNRVLLEQLAARQRESEALEAISSTLVSTLDFQEALRRICRELARLVAADAASAYVLDRASDALAPLAGYHVPKGLLERLGSTSLPLTELDPRLPLWRERRPVFSDDVAGDSRFDHPAFRIVPHQAGLLVPLVLDGEVAGAFYLAWWTERRRFTAHELGMIERVSGQVSLFLRNVRLYEQAERSRRRLETLNQVSRRLAEVHDTDAALTLIVEEATRLLGGDAAGLRLIEGDELVMRAHTRDAEPLMSQPRLPAGQYLAGRIVSTGQPVVLEDLTADPDLHPEHRRSALRLGYHGFVGVPLRAQGHTLGTLNIYTRRRHRFPSDEVSLLAAFADQASLALVEARLYAEARAREREAALLYDVATALGSSVEIDRVLDLVCAKTVEVLGSDAAGILGYSEVNHELTYIRDLNVDPELVAGVVIRSGEGVAGRAYSERRTVWTRDFRRDPSVSYAAATGRLVAAGRTRALMAAPMLSRGGVQGVLVAHFFESRDATAEDLRILSTLAHHAAIAMDNARLLDEAQRQRNHLAQIFDATSDGMMLITRDGQIVSANRRAGELLAFDPAALSGLGLTGLLAGHFASGADYYEAVTPLQSLLDDPDRSGEGDLDLPVTRRILHWVGRPTRGPSGATGLTLTFHDVTQDREVSRMKSDFVSFVTHQLRTPLSGIRWLLEVAAQSGGVTAECAGYVQDARGAAGRLIALVNDLLDISRLESGKVLLASRAVDLGELTGSVVGELESLLRDRGHRLSVRGADTVPAITADAQLLRQVMINLVSNAIKYTPPGGEIVIGMSRDGGEVAWSVTDNGIGIPKDGQRRLFEKFYRADNVLTVETEGSGLGLCLVKLIVARLGGRVWCESEEGRGSTFSFTVPL